MPAEFEELRLQVTLDDQATAKLDQLKKAFDFTSAIAQTKELQKALDGVGDTSKLESYRKSLGGVSDKLGEVKRHSAEASEGLKGLGENLVAIQGGFERFKLTLPGIVGSLGQVNKGVGSIAESFNLSKLAVGGFAVGIIGAGVVLEKYLSTLTEWSQRQSELGKTATATGVPAGQIKAIEDVYARSNVPREAAQADIAGAAEAQADLRKDYMTERVKRLLGPQDAFRQQRVQALQALRNAPDTAAYLTILRAQQQQLHDVYLERHPGDEVGAAQVAGEWGEQLGARNLRNVRGPIPTATPAQNAQQQQATDASNAFLEQIANIKTAWEDLKTKFNVGVLPAVTQALTPISENFAKWAESLKAEDFKKFADSLSAIVTQLGQFNWKPVLDSLSGIASAFSDVLGLAKDAGLILSDAATLVARLKPASARTPEEQAAVNANVQAHLERAEQKRQEQIRILNPNLKPGERPSVYPVTESGAVPGGRETPSGPWRQQLTTADISQALGVSYGFEAREPSKYSDIVRGAGTYGGARGLEMAPGEGFMGSPGRILPRIEPPAIPPMSQQAPPGLGYTPPLGQPTFASFDRHADLIADQNRALGDLTIELKKLSDIFEEHTTGMMGGQPPTTFADRFSGESRAADLRPIIEGQRPETRSIAMRQPQMPPEPGHEWLSAIDPQTGRRPLDQPTSAQEVGSRWPLIDRNPLYTALQREMTHKIEAKGRMTVDVSAPAGTQVGADFDNLFTDLEINRQIQMEPAGTTARRPTIYGPN